ncbi:MFS transporter [Eisenbergiella sp.]
METKKLTSSQVDGVQYRTTKSWLIPFIMMAGGCSACFSTIIGYISYAANLGFGISIVLIGFFITFARIFDGITDPLISMLIDRTNTRFGKIRIFMVIGWLIQIISIKCLFDWFNDGTHSIIIFLILYLIYYIGYTCLNMSSQLIGPVLTNDPKQRPIVNVWSIFYAYVISIVLSIGVTIVLLPKYEYTYTPELLATLANFTIIVSGIFLFISLIAVTSIDKPENFIVTSDEKKSAIKFKDMWDMLKSNRALQCFILAATSDKLATQVTAQSIISTILYGIIIGNMALSAIINIVGIVPILIFSMIAGKYVGKHGSKESIIFWSRINIGLSVLSMLFILVTAGTNVSKSLPLVIVFVVLSMLANGLRITLSIASSSMMSDTIDYESAKSQKFMPGTIAGVYSFIDKLVSSLGAVIASVSIALIGYKDTVPQPADPKTMPIVVIGAFLFYGIPIMGWICSLIAMKFTPISKEGMIEVQKTIVHNKENNS